MRKPMYTLLFVLLGAFFVAGCPDEKSTDGPADPAAGTAKVDKPTQPPTPAVAQVQEVEPNETTAQAMELTKDCLVQAKMEAAAGKTHRAKDWYRIVSGADKVLAVSVGGIEGEDLRLSLLDKDRNELFWVDSTGPGGAERVPNLKVDEAVYLRVSGAKGGAGGDYSLKITFSAPVEGFEREFNGRYSTADELALGKRVQGYLGHQRDEDWYLLDLKELPTASVLRMELSAVEGVRFGLEILDKDERAPILKVRSAKPGDGIVVRNLGVPGTPQAVYVKIVSAWVTQPKPKKSIRTFNPDKPYTLSVSSEAGGDDLEREPNDDAEDALPLTDGQKIRGYLSAANDVDWYKLEVEKPSLLAAELSALNRVNLRLQVVDPAKKDSKKNYHLMRIDDGKVNEAEVLTNCALQPGTNYLRVEGSYKKVDGRWLREAFNLDETYELTVHLRSDDGREEQEPNGKTEVATPISVGATLRGTLHPKGDWDAFKLDLSSQDGPRNTVVECTGIPKLDISLTLLGPEMDDKGKNKVVASSAKGKGEEKEQITKELMPGEYFIVVKGRPSSESNTRDQYVLTVTQP
ncbi:MAG: hypothetical protein JRF33_00070 [Deltaproteobacteria bacterium]|nr:hypothetical protein [Deltaproteobacteria bacterium]